VAISVKLIRELRAATGAGVLDTKRALESTGGDFDQAARILREKGLAKAAKRTGRETAEGHVEGRLEDKRVGLLVEVNCETDFVSRNENFVAFSNDLADHFFAVAQEGQPLEEVMNAAFFKDAGATPAEMLKGQISTTGENMVVRRFVRYELDKRPGVVEVYIHPGNRVGVMLELNSETAAGASQEAFATLSHDLALHIAAAAPLCITRDELSAEKLKAKQAIYRNQALAEGKPEQIVERIVEGRLKKFYQSAVLLEQPFVKDDKISITKLLKQNAAALGEALTIRRFARYELGESLD